MRVCLLVFNKMKMMILMHISQTPYLTIWKLKFHFRHNKMILIEKKIKMVV